MEDEGVCMSGKEIVCVSKPVQGLVKKNDSSVVKLTMASIMVTILHTLKNLGV